MALSGVCVLLLIASVGAFRSLSLRTARRHGSFVKMMSDGSDAQEYSHYKYDSVAISGLVSEKDNFANPFVFNNLFAKDTGSKMKALTDSVAFARKRLVNPKTVYSGLFDVLEFTEVSPDMLDSYKEALQGTQVWVAFNVSSSKLDDYVSVAVEAGVKRVVFGVSMETDADKSADNALDSATNKLSDADIQYTLIKYGDVAPGSEALKPYRIVRDVLPLPNQDLPPLSSDDLLRVISEAVDLPKTFNTVYGMGPGTSLDSEILVFMKSRGWPERVQVGMLMGDIMEKIEAKVDEERERAAKEAETSTKLSKTPSAGAGAVDALPEEGKGNKYAGFFS